MVRTVHSSNKNESFVLKPITPFCLRKTNGINEQDGYHNDTSISESIHKDNSTVQEEETSTTREPIMNLTSAERGAVLGAFFYGYFIMPISGGRLADRYGTKRVFGIAVLLDGTLNFLVPMAAKTHFGALIFVRFLIGLVQGACYPSLHSLMARWIPPAERGRFMGFVYLANCVSIIISMPVSGIVVASLGWEAIFYVVGGVCYSWVIMWVLLFYDTPEEHPWISDGEKKYVIEKISVSALPQKPQSVRWKELLTSVPLWAITVAGAGNVYGLNMLVTQLPTYMDSIIGLSLRKSASLSAVPFLSRYIGSNVISWTGSYFVNKQILTMPFSKKLFNTIGFMSPAIIMAFLSLAGCDPYLTLALISLGTFLNGAITVGYLGNHLDIAPNLAGTTYGVSASISLAFTMMAPVVVGVLTPNQDMLEWRTVFWVASGIYTLSNLFYLKFCSFELQPWNFESGPNAKM